MAEDERGLLAFRGSSAQIRHFFAPASNALRTVHGLHWFLSTATARSWLASRQVRWLWRPFRSDGFLRRRSHYAMQPWIPSKISQRNVLDPVLATPRDWLSKELFGRYAEICFLTASSRTRAVQRVQRAKGRFFT